MTAIRDQIVPEAPARRYEDFEGGAPGKLRQLPDVSTWRPLRVLAPLHDGPLDSQSVAMPLPLRSTPQPEGTLDAITRASNDSAWPIIGRLPMLAQSPRPDEPSAFQAVRRLPSARSRGAVEALAALPAVGAGEPLPVTVRRSMERLQGRDLSGVRLHTAGVAEMLNVEAFTTGDHVVFAPGRLDLGSIRGLALLGHELAHVGQVLAFKQAADAEPAPEDAEERYAREQEGLVQRIIEHGWPKEPRVMRKQPAPTPTHLPAMITVDAPPTEAIARRSTNDPSTTADAEGAERGSMDGDTSAATAPRGPSSPSADIDGLARQVYSLIKARLRAERDRHQVYAGGL
ncbi:MAG: DUF4157 domain-containing protein [Anaerolineae bacterium]